MFERFTERAQHVVVLAQEEARALKHNYVGTEHLLAGLLREEDSLGAKVLRDELGLTLEVVRSDIKQIVGLGENAVEGQVPFTPRMKNALELALRDALGLGHNYIGTEHVLLGLVRENAGVGARILADHDIGPDDVRNTVVRLLTGSVPEKFWVWSENELEARLIPASDIAEAVHTYRDSIGILEGDVYAAESVVRFHVTTTLERVS